MQRLIIIDECLDKRLAGEVSKRGWRAVAHTRVGITGQLDPDALAKLATIPEPWTLVTADDHMPWDHGNLLATIGATVATVEGEWERVCSQRGLALTQEEFKRETVHRWIHRIHDQMDGTIRRYSPVSSTTWTVRKKHATRPRD